MGFKQGFPSWIWAGKGERGEKMRKRKGERKKEGERERELWKGTGFDI